MEMNMRPKNRIKRILNKLEKWWLKNSDLRLGQFLSNIAKIEDIDIFYLEDSTLENNLDIILYENKKTKRRTSTKKK